MNVLSLFDGMSCGQIALERAGIKVDNYFASEIDKYAIQITQKNYPDTVQLGDVTKWREWDLPKIDLILAGSPCQGFSFAGKQLAFDDPRSKLFFDFVDIRWHYEPDNYLLENVKMKGVYRDKISEILGVESVRINSNLFTAHNRDRFYWTELDIETPEDRGIFIADILESNPPDYTKVSEGWLTWWNKNKEFQLKKKYSAYANVDGKAICCTARQYASWNGNFIYQLARGNNKGGDRGFSKTPSMTSSCWHHNNIIVGKDDIRRLSCVECERLQTVPDNYTEGVSNTQRYKMLGNGWTVDVIAHILKGLTL